MRRPARLAGVVAHPASVSGSKVSSSPVAMKCFTVTKVQSPLVAPPVLNRISVDHHSRLRADVRVGERSIPAVLRDRGRSVQTVARRAVAGGTDGLPAHGGNPLDDTTLRGFLKGRLRPERGRQDSQHNGGEKRRATNDT